MTASRFTITIPMVAVKGTAYYRRSNRHSVIQTALIESIHSTSGDVRQITDRLGLPEPVIARLVAEASSQGKVTWDSSHSRVALSENAKDAITRGTLGDLLGTQLESVEFEVAVDLVNGLTHHYDWAMGHERRQDEGTSTLPRQLEENAVLDKLREVRIETILRSSTISNKFNPEHEDRIVLENVESIGDLRLLRTFDVTVEIAENRSRSSTRWLVDAPDSIVETMRLIRPELFEIKYRHLEARDSWTQSQPGVLLGEIEEIWGRLQEASSSRATYAFRKEFSRYAVGAINNARKRWKGEHSANSDARFTDAWCGAAEYQGSELSKLLSRVKKRVVIVTSFVNKKYVKWVAEVFSTLPENAEVLLLYGHANEEGPSVQASEAASYCAALRSHLRSDIQLRIGVTTGRTHEKIVVSDTSDCVVGSWNVCSSNPNSEHFEASLTFKSKEIATQLCSMLETECKSEEAVFIQAVRKSLYNTWGLKGTNVARHIIKLVKLTQMCADELNFTDRAWKHFWIDLWIPEFDKLRDLLWTYFDSPPIMIVSSETLRDVFVEQIRSANRSLLIATDRVNPNGLDASLITHLLERHRLIRVIWGMESPEWDMTGDPEAQGELDIARETIQSLQRSGRGCVLTSCKPMLNHSKLLLVDEERILISSNNFLARGAETTDQSSREVGILIESPLLARKVLGQLMLHSEDIRGMIEFSKLESQPWDLYERLRMVLEELFEQKDIEIPGKPETISFALKSTFLDFDQNGHIVGEKDGKYRFTDVGLGKRWEYCMKRFGSAKNVSRENNLLPFHESVFFTYVCEMTGIQRRYSHGMTLIAPRRIRPEPRNRLGKAGNCVQGEPTISEEDSMSAPVEDSLVRDYDREQLYSFDIRKK